MRLKSDIQAKAVIRTAQAAGAFAAVVRRGDSDAGDLVVKVNRLDGTAQLFARYPQADGRFLFSPASDTPEPEGRVDEALQRRLQTDPDLWVVEVEDRQGRSFTDTL